MMTKDFTQEKLFYLFRLACHRLGSENIHIEPVHVRADEMMCRVDFEDKELENSSMDIFGRRIEHRFSLNLMKDFFIGAPWEDPLNGKKDEELVKVIVELLRTQWRQWRREQGADITYTIQRALGFLATNMSILLRCESAELSQGKSEYETMYRSFGRGSAILPSLARPELTLNIVDTPRDASYGIVKREMEYRIPLSDLNVGSPVDKILPSINNFEDEIDKIAYRLAYVLYNGYEFATHNKQREDFLPRVINIKQTAF